MIAVYLKQAWNLLRQEKLFSSIYIIGTGLSITIVMVLSIIYYIRIANVYPETNRDRLLVVKSASEKFLHSNAMNSSALSLQFIDECLRPIEDIEVLTVMKRDNDEHYAQLPVGRDQIPVVVKYVDVAFWNVYPFHFLEGKPFMDADFTSALTTAVISESMAKRLFGRTDVVGEYASLDFRQFRVCGVVRDASYATGRTFAHFWLPYTIAEPDEWNGTSGYLGNMEAIILAHSKDNFASIKEKTNAWLRQYNLSTEELELSLNGQPDEHWQSTFRFWSNDNIDFGRIISEYAVIFLILLLVPAISLSGMTDSRMERRIAEMGLRRAFGAPVKNLMGQVLSENFVFTFLGGLAGLLFSYLAILVSSDWIMSIGQYFVDAPPEGTKVLFTPSMLLNIPVFLIALSVCFLLNLMTSLIPAWRASHKDIIYSLNAKQ